VFTSPDLWLVRDVSHGNDLVFPGAALERFGLALDAIRAQQHIVGGLHSQHFKGALSHCRAKATRGLRPYGFLSRRDGLAPRGHRRRLRVGVSRLAGTNRRYIDNSRAPPRGNLGAAEDLKREEGE
jgi:hypothetical protein